MAVEQMILLNMSFDKADLYDILFQLKEAKNFYPQNAKKMMSNVKGVQAVEENPVYTKIMDRLIDIASSLRLDLDSQMKPDRHFNIKSAEAYLSQVETEVKRMVTIYKELEQEKYENEMTCSLLKQISSSSIDSDQLNSCQYIDIRFGRLPKRYINQLSYYEGKPFILKTFEEDKEGLWCCYITTKNVTVEVDNIFSSMAFERVDIPPFVHGTFESALQELEEETKAMEEYLLRCQQSIVSYREKHKVDLLKMYANAKYFQDIEAFKVFVVDYQKQQSIYGFIPERELESFQSMFSHIEDVYFQKLPAHLLEEKDMKAPTLVHNSFWVAPFEKVNAVKKYGSVDTTLLTAIFYYVTFSVFMGDIGVGLLLAVVSLFLKKQASKVLCRALSIATLLGGLVYGSVFYTLHLYQGLTLPLSLTVRAVDGVMLIVLGTITAKFIQSMSFQKEMVDRFFSWDGICGLLIVYATVIYLALTYEFQVNVPLMPLMMTVTGCIVAILLKDIFIKQRK